jgi:CubicO group peptidase (beta-lactamase class C family)
MPVRPEEVGLSSERLARIDRHLLENYVDKKKIAGALTLVARKGQVAYLSPVGMMDRERGKPMRDDTIFRIYSMTKPITSVALMTLYEEGRFMLGDPVHKLIPEWRDLEVYVAGVYPDFMTERCERSMTIRDLMCHMSGLTYGFMMRSNVDHAYRKLDVGGAAAQGTLRDMIEKLATLPLEFSPGTRWNYSVSTDVLGYLVEVLSGMRFDDYLRERIFEPLGMVDTDFTVPAEKLERFAANYERRPDKTVVLEDDPADSRYTRPRSFLSGGGGLVSTAADYQRFCQMLLNGGELDGHRILGRKTIELMTMNHLPEGKNLADLSIGLYSETNMEGVGFGLGFSVCLDPAQSQMIDSAGEYAWGGAASTAFWIDPRENLVVIFLTQLMPSNTFNFRGQLKALTYSALI